MIAAAQETSFSGCRILGCGLLNLLVPKRTRRRTCLPSNRGLPVACPGPGGTYLLCVIWCTKRAGAYTDSPPPFFLFCFLSKYDLFSFANLFGHSHEEEPLLPRPSGVEISSLSRSNSEARFTSDAEGQKSTGGRDTYFSFMSMSPKKGGKSRKKVKNSDYL